MPGAEVGSKDDEFINKRWNMSQTKQSSHWQPAKPALWRPASYSNCAWVMPGGEEDLGLACCLKEQQSGASVATGRRLCPAYSMK